MKNKLQMDSTN